MITYNKAIAAVITVTLVNGFFSTNMMKKYKEMYSDQVEHLETKNENVQTYLFSTGFELKCFYVFQYFLVSYLQVFFLLDL